MSGKKFELTKLIQYRRKHLNCLPPMPLDAHAYGYNVDWEEFNKMFFSKRHVIVEYSRQSQYNALLLMGFYSGLKVAKEGHSIGMCNYGSGNSFPYSVEFARSISSKANVDNMFFSYYTFPERIGASDEWILNADWTSKPSLCPATPDSDGSQILAEIVKSNGFNYQNKSDRSNRRIIVGWEGKKERPDTKFVIFWDDRGKEGLERVAKEYGDKFVIIPYTEEKRLVDEWYRKNETMVDPGFDIQMMKPEINQRKVLLYASTNHLQDFRRFAKVLPEVVNQHFSKEELKCLL